MKITGPSARQRSRRRCGSVGLHLLGNWLERHHAGPKSRPTGTGSFNIYTAKNQNCTDFWGHFCLAPELARFKLELIRDWSHINVTAAQSNETQIKRGR